VLDQRHEALQAAYSSLNDGDLDAVLGFLGADFELEPSWESAQAGIYKGTDAVRAVLEAWSQPFESLYYEVEEMLDGEGGCIVVLVKLTAVPRGERHRTQVGISHVWQYEGAQPKKLRVYFGREPGLEAGGIPLDHGP
jgi:ketosteroid isomerase-like protein